jgi:hypothetical protein
MKIHKLISFILSFSITSCCIVNSYAAEIKPFYTKNQSPLIQIFGLPAVGDATVLKAGNKQLGIGVDLTSNYVSDVTGNERLILDGETTRYNINGRYGLGHGLEVGFEIPYLIQGGGFLDDFIIRYHDAFGFPQGGRDLAPRNRLLYLYSAGGINKLKIDSSGAGLGDIRLIGAWQLYKNAANSEQTVALKSSLKLPTGDSGELLGSGSTDLAFWLAGNFGHSTALGPVAFWGGAGLLGMAEGNVLQDQQRNFVGFGNLGAGISPASWISLKLQLDGHTSFYRNSGLKEIDAAAVQIVIGGTLAFNKRISLDIGVVEDLLVNTSPDVVFNLMLNIRF